MQYDRTIAEVKVSMLLVAGSAALLATLRMNYATHTGSQNNINYSECTSVSPNYLKCASHCVRWNATFTLQEIDHRSVKV